MNNNNERFIADQKTFFSGSYEQFVAFGGPCVYFHRECLIAGQNEFLSDRHIEMLYATLTAWGMHRMGSAEVGKTKLTDWDTFRTSLTAQTDALRKFRNCRLLNMSCEEYSDAIVSLETHYAALNLSISDATIVVNSKALHHLFPEFIPPIDRQYTIRFFQDSPDRWFDRKGKFRAIQLPAGRAAQFRLFHSICMEIKRLSEIVDPTLLHEQRNRYGVPPPKALDNALVNYVRLVSREMIRARSAASSG